MAKRGAAIVKALKQGGWTLKRCNGRHEVWHCPCKGKHMFVRSTSGQGGRAEKNQLLQLRRTGCPTVKDIK